jgi:ubiquinone/menaquinone biosynthesis C-methylase UbiE
MLIKEPVIMYEVVEISLASVRRLYDYHINEVYGADFSIKGFDRPWLISSHAWQAGDHVLDVGAAYSNIPLHIQQKYGCEVWVADDFGLNSNESFWTRDRSPHEHIAAHPDVKYVLERLGDKKSSLPENYFDVIYSLSALEHVPGELTASVWAHMDRLLKPGGELIHAIDMPFPSNFGISGFLKVIIFEMLFPILPINLKVKYFRVTPRSYLKLALPVLGVNYRRKPELSPVTMALNPDILTESYAHGLNRIKKDGVKNFRYQREGSLLVHLRKTT